jgi:hypothetical protein
MLWAKYKSLVDVEPGFAFDAARIYRRKDAK